MRLDALLSALPAVLERHGPTDIAVNRLTVDSRHVSPGDLFIAIPGVNVDGHRFIADAVAAGAVAVVGERERRAIVPAPVGLRTYIRVPDAREAWAWLCAAERDFPSRKMTLIGVTGTDGKTTTVNLTYSILRAAGLAAGMVSTVAARIGDTASDTGLHTTTPDPPDVQRYLARMVAAGTTHAVLEVTSHGLAQHRVTGCDFDIAVVTNVTPEHLDYHGTFEAYLRAKSLLFQNLSRSFRKPGTPKVAVVNWDDEPSRRMSAFPADRLLVYTTRPAVADRPPGAEVLSARDLRLAPDGLSLTLHTPAGRIPVASPLTGEYNVSNILAAAAVGVALNLPPEAIAEGVAALSGVPGRMERIEEGQDFRAIVDFAHTPNALRRALMAARRLTDAGGRVLVVFGAAGLRDHSKRPAMGRIAGRLADVVVVTAEDPRTENLDEIMAAIGSAAEAEGKRVGEDLWLVADRGKAILTACQMARAGDVVIACGKGHEQSMCFGTVEYPWDDREAMRRALRGEILDTLPTAGEDKG